MTPPAAAIVPVRDRDRAELPALVASLREQAEVVLVDHTRAGDLAVPGAIVVRDPSRSRGRAYLAGLENTDAEWILWAEPGALADPDRAARQLARAAQRPDARLVTADVRLVESGTPTGRQLAVDLALPHPPAFWRSGVLVHRDELARVDPAAFAPAELALVERLRAEGAAIHLAEAVASVADPLARARAEEAEHDARLLELARAPHDAFESPLVTVLLACHDRMDVLPDCLAGFARQLVPPGTLELVVCDDGSTDGTAEFLASLELPVPYRFTTGPNAGACAARNRGLDLVRGRYVLFVNDDTIPAPDLVARHLEAHRSLGGERVAVLGAFEQPPEAMRRALTRVLERGTFVFAYPELAPGERLDGRYFYTCNVSVPADAVRAAGRFDEDFPWYTEDTEFGLRLERLGYGIRYRPEARAWHHHPPTFEGMKRRQPAVAKAHVRLFAKYPELLQGGQAGLSAGAIRASHRVPRKHLPEFEDALRALADVDLASLEEAGGGMAALAGRIESRLAELFGKVNALWWLQGIEDGLVESGLRGLADLAADRPAELPDVGGPLVLLHPSAEEPGRWVAVAEQWLGCSDAELAELGLEDAVLGVVAEPVRGVAAPAVLEVLEALARRRERTGASPRPTVVVATDEGPASAVRLLAASEAWLATGAARDDEDRDLAGATRAREIDLLATDCHARPPQEGSRPWPLAIAAGERLAAWPRWSEAPAIDALVRALGPMAACPGAGVVLVHDDELDGPLEPAVQRLSDAWRARYGEGASLEVVIESVRAGAMAWERFAGSVDAVLATDDAGAGERAVLERLGLPRLADRRDVAVWLHRERAPARVRVVRARDERTEEEVCHA